MKSRPTPSSIDKLEAYCIAHDVEVVRHSKKELWLFIEGRTPDGKRMFVHRFIQTSSKAVRVESAVTQPIKDSTRNAGKSRCQSTEQRFGVDWTSGLTVLATSFSGQCIGAA